MEPWDKEKAQAMRDQGMSYAKIAVHFGTTDMTVMCRLDEKYAEHRRRRTNKLRSIDGPPLRSILPLERHPDQEDVAARLAEIPPDTRSLTQRLCGDPLPGRSAFDRLYR
jgi:hypothetical protein